MSETGAAKPRTSTCVECGTTWYTRPLGAKPKRCPACQTVRTRILHREQQRARHVPRVREYVCVVCGDTCEKHGRGLIPKRCNECRRPPRTVTCQRCGTAFDRPHARGDRPRFCHACTSIQLGRPGKVDDLGMKLVDAILIVAGVYRSGGAAGKDYLRKLRGAVSNLLYHFDRWRRARG